MQNFIGKNTTYERPNSCKINLLYKEKYNKNLNREIGFTGKNTMNAKLCFAFIQQIGKKDL